MAGERSGASGVRGGLAGVSRKAGAELGEGGALSDPYRVGPGGIAGRLGGRRAWIDRANGAGPSAPGPRHLWGEGEMSPR